MQSNEEKSQDFCGCVFLFLFFLLSKRNLTNSEIADINQIKLSAFSIYFFFFCFLSSYFIISCKFDVESEISLLFVSRFVLILSIVNDFQFECIRFSFSLSENVDCHLMGIENVKDLRFLFDWIIKTRYISSFIALS